MTARRAGRSPAGGPRLWCGSVSDAARPGIGYPGALQPAPETVPGRQRLLEQFAMPRPSLPLRTSGLTPGAMPAFPWLSPTTIEKQNGPGRPTPPGHTADLPPEAQLRFGGDPLRPPGRLPDLRDVGKRHLAEHALYRLVDGLPHRTQSAAGCVDTVGIVRFHTPPRCRGALEDVKSLAEVDRLRSARQDVPSGRPALAGHETCPSQRCHQLVEIRFGEPLPGGNLMGLHRAFAVMAGQVNQGSQPVLRASRYFHRTITLSSLICPSATRNARMSGASRRASDTITYNESG